MKKYRREFKLTKNKAMRITSLDQLKDGMRVKGSIMGDSFEVGLVVVSEHGNVYIYQDEVKGSICSNDRRGYKYYWHIWGGNFEDAELEVCEDKEWREYEALKEVGAHLDWTVKDLGYKIANMTLVKDEKHPRWTTARERRSWEIEAYELDRLKKKLKSILMG